MFIYWYFNLYRNTILFKMDIFQEIFWLMEKQDAEKHVL